MSEANNTSDKKHRHKKSKSSVSTFSGIVFCVIGSVVASFFIIMPEAFLGDNWGILGILLPALAIFLFWTASSRVSWWAILSGVIFILIGFYVFILTPTNGSIITIIVGASLILYNFYKRQKNRPNGNIQAEEQEAPKQSEYLPEDNDLAEQYRSMSGEELKTLLEGAVLTDDAKNTCLAVLREKSGEDSASEFEMSHLARKEEGFPIIIRVVFAFFPMIIGAFLLFYPLLFFYHAGPIGPIYKLDPQDLMVVGGFGILALVGFGLMLLGIRIAKRRGAWAWPLSLSITISLIIAYYLEISLQ